MVTRLRLNPVRTWARHSAPAFLALYLVSNILVRSFSDVWLFIGWTSLCCGIFLGGWSRGPSGVFYGLITLLIFHALAIPGSLIWGNGNWELTAGVVLWMAPALLLYLANDGGRVFTWLVPAFLAHALLVIVEGLTNWSIVGDVMVRQGTNTGLANNPNLAAGFLIIGAIYLLNGPKSWLSLPLLVALVFTGSRWGLVVAALLLLAMVATRAISWRPLAGAVVALVFGVVLLGMFAGTGYRVAGYGSITSAAQSAQTDIGVRLAVPHIPSFLPHGVAEHPGLHNVPMRIAVENGILAAGLWVLISGWALICRARPALQKNDHIGYQYDHQQGRHYPGIDCWRVGKYDKQESNINGQTDGRAESHFRWILLALVLLSVLDYYTWMGHLGGFWWLMIGQLAKRAPPCLICSCIFNLPLLVHIQSS